MSTVSESDEIVPHSCMDCGNEEAPYHAQDPWKKMRCLDCQRHREGGGLTRLDRLHLRNERSIVMSKQRTLLDILERMAELAEVDGPTDESHVEADDLLCEALMKIGEPRYSRHLVNLYRSLNKWYS